MANVKEERKSSIVKPSETCSCIEFSDKSKAIKNLLGVCISFICSLGAFLGPLYLQSSLNVAAGLGLISSALVYGTQILFLFFAPTITCLLGTKYTIILGYSLLAPYTVANYYPNEYTLYPTSVLAGMGLALMFSNAQAHNSFVAAKHAEVLKENESDAIVLFAGVFSMAVKIAQITGSLIGSATLINFKGSDDDNNTFSMSNESCTNMDAMYTEEDNLYYVLISVYVLISIAGIIIGLSTIDHLGTQANFLSPSTIVKRYLIEHVFKILKLMCNWRMLLMFPLFSLNGLSLGFLVGTFSKFYISDCVGISWIGFVIIVNSVSSAIAGLIMGRLYKYVPSWIVISLIFLLEIGLSLFLIFWERSPNFYVIFGFVIGWGICDAAWLGFVSGMVGAIFVDHVEPAFAVYNILVSIGFSVSFTIGLFLSPANQLWIIFSVLVIATITYTILVIALKICKDKTVRIAQSEKEEVCEEAVL